jgi:hypothetical protein
MLSENKWKQRDKNESVNKEARNCRGCRQHVLGVLNSKTVKQK